ncbi:ATP-binding cassette domain-containing protein [Thermodesulfobacteriota bacterium]
MGEMNNKNIIIIKDVRHVYKGNNVALDNINLEVGTGLFGLLGPNGAGKSTLMRIICTLLVPTQGSVTVGGFDVVSQRRKVRPFLGYLPQEFNAWRLHRVGEVLDTLASLSGLEDNASRKERVFYIIESVGLQDVVDRKVKKLSGGMVRRLGVAQALMHDPEVLIVDEPTVGLDPEERIHFRQLMAKLGQDRIIVLSTHIVGDLSAGCHDMALINHGKVEFRGSPVELINQSKGWVFQLSIPKEKEYELIESIEIVSREETGNEVTIRAVSKDGLLPDGAQPVSDPTLEEAYLAFMSSGGRNVLSSGKEDL